MVDPTQQMSDAMTDVAEKLALAARLKTAETLLTQTYGQLKALQGEHTLLLTANAEFHKVITELKRIPGLVWLAKVWLKIEL